MLDSAQKRKAMIDHLEAALALSEELHDPITGFLIERAINEARAQGVGDISPDSL